jgi:hypothetical protein
MDPVTTINLYQMIVFFVLKDLPNLQPLIINNIVFQLKIVQSK